MLDADQNQCPTATGLSKYLDTWGSVGLRARAVFETIGVLDHNPVKSRLTPTGRPLEFGFTQADDDLRYTVEVDDPGGAPQQRLQKSVRLLADLGAPPIDPDLLQQVIHFQAQGTLRYGAWLGVRHGPTHDKYKLYAELPEDAGPDVDTFLTRMSGQRHLAPGPAPRCRMIGMDAGQDRVEIYLAGQDMLRSALPLLMARARLADHVDHADKMLDLINTMSPFPPTAKFPARDIGFSYAMSGQGGAAAFTLYLIAQKMFGDDQTAFAWMQEHGAIAGHTRLAPHLPITLVHHGMFGLTMCAGFSAPLISTGVAAP